ncbi:MAG: 4-hydroxy-tetrahydrodipicolinate reductase [Micrococcales bacterium]|nr:4-hydroxy-tetrahydrodipicolinate reductase [Micrococcales bacterium]
MVTRVAVVGATGRMGRLALDLIGDAPDLEVAATLDSRTPLEAIQGSDLVLDVRAPAASPGIVDAALERGIPALVGTSGWSAERLATLEQRLRELPDLGVIVVPNFSIGSVLATRCAEIAATYFDSAEIVEAHHAGKVDSPSGTAIRTAERMAAARRELGPVAAPHADQRARGQQVASIPVHSLRLAGVEARQEVIFGGTGETLRLTHDTYSSRAYEAGMLLALRAAPGNHGLLVGLDALLTR